ncbi:hypothetical protein D9M72_641060 [compost metagenome]
MICDDDQRRGRQVARRPFTLEPEAHVDQLQHLAEDTVALADNVGPPAGIELGVSVATRQALHGADEPALQAPVVFVSVGQLFELHGSLRWMASSEALRYPDIPLI